jgi:hypothetical protein
MKIELFKKGLKVLEDKKQLSLIDRNKPLLGESISGVKVKKVNGRSMPYADRHRGNWFKPEYDLTEIQIAQDTDAFLYKAIQKKVQRFVLAGWEFVGNDKERVDYIKRRIKEIEYVSGQPFNLLMSDLAHDLIRYSNHAWVKVRNKDASTGKVRKIDGKDVEPVAGYFVLPFESLWFKVKKNGEIKKVMQEQHNTGEWKEFAPQDVVHFYTNRKPGFTMGTPEILPVLEDLSLLRRLEESIENMIDANLHPLFHYKVGNDNMPERYGPDGIKESDLVRQTIEYMPSGGIFVSDHRHNIEAIGSQGKALDIRDYLEYFKKRVYAGLGVSPMDMGEADSANSSTANTLSKIAIQDVEALQKHIKTFVETYVIGELLAEGGYEDSLLDSNKMVYIKFGSVDKEEKSKEENQTIQLWLNNLISEQEARKRLGEQPVDSEYRNQTNYKLYTEPLALIKAMSAGSAASDALSKSESSNITAEAIKKEEQRNEKMRKQTGPGIEKGNGAENTSNSVSRPSNQFGTRNAPKFNKDIENLFFEIKQGKKIIDILETLEKGSKNN